MAKAKQDPMDDMSAINLDNPDAMTDQERENLQMQLNDSNQRLTKMNKKSM